MTVGNKLLMSGDRSLMQHKGLVLLVQNLIAVLALGALALFRVVRISAVDRKQLLFFCWDALVLVVQTWTSFEALQHLPVSATTVVRALAIPSVAWCERLFLGTKIGLAQHAMCWAVVAGAIVYTCEDLVTSTSSYAHSAAGYAWCFANLLAYVSNSVLDRVMMSESNQTASGLSLLTQALSLPHLLGARCALQRPDPGRRCKRAAVLGDTHDRHAHHDGTMCRSAWQLLRTVLQACVGDRRDDDGERQQGALRLGERRRLRLAAERATGRRAWRLSGRRVCLLTHRFGRARRRRCRHRRVAWSAERNAPRSPEAKASIENGEWREFTCSEDGARLEIEARHAGVTTHGRKALCAHVKNRHTCLAACLHAIMISPGRWRHKVPTIP